MKIGAHLSIAKGLAATAQRVQDIGANCLQIFASPPRNWNSPKWTKEIQIEFGNILKSKKIGPNYIHVIHLVHLNTENEDTRKKCIQSVVECMEFAKNIQAQGVVVHSHKPTQKYIDSVHQIVEHAPKQVQLIIEHSAQTNLEQTLSVFDKNIIDRLSLCLDTCHLFAAGYDISKKKVISDTLSQIDKAIGLNKLELIHLNDAKYALGSGRDVHDNIGEGQIGLDSFRYLLNHPQLKNLPFIIETPGFDKKGPDKKNIDILKSLIIQ